MDDVIIVGGGVMGCASALALAKRGISVGVLERSVPGAEASSAAAGMLGAQMEMKTDSALARLCLASRALYAPLAAELYERTGIDTGYRACGVLRVAFTEAEKAHLDREFGWQVGAELPIEQLDGPGARAIEPALSTAAAAAMLFPKDGRVDPPAFLQALRIAAERAGARFRSGSYVRRVLTDANRARGLELEDGSIIEAGHVVVAAGSWSSLVDGTTLPPQAVRPARGQIVELALPAPILRGIVFGPRCYLSPRNDGRVLVGSTLEFVGFQRGVTARAVRNLLDAAIELIPALAEASVGPSWSSFRPHTPDELPLIGPTTVERLSLATGHYRNGILLAPITAELIAKSIAGEPLGPDAAAFSPMRLG
jgi:glycine oxidase